MLIKYLLKWVGIVTRPSVSFEFFPPKTPAGLKALLKTAKRLRELSPEFVSVTYGAGGSTRETTESAVHSLRDSLALDVAPHLTCVDASREETMRIASSYINKGVRKIVALRGDPREGAAGVYTPHPDGFPYAADLVEGISADHEVDVYVSAYPEKHPAAPSLDFDIEVLKQKELKGATAAITQFFFDNDDFLRYRDKATTAGVSIPIIPGIMVPENIRGIMRFAKSCGASVPANLISLFSGIEDDEETCRLIATHFSIKQCEQLTSEGVDQLHIYTLNRAEATYALSHSLGLNDRLDRVA